MTSKNAFKPFTNPTEEDAGGQPAGYEVLAMIGNDQGWTVRAVRMPYYEITLEFAEIAHPDGTSSYLRLEGEDAVAGPFGGGYSWALPKYVVKACETMLREQFIPTPEEVPA